MNIFVFEYEGIEIIINNLHLVEVLSNKGEKTVEVRTVLGSRYLFKGIGDILSKQFDPYGHKRFKVTGYEEITS